MLSEILVRELANRHLTCATAESCTGGGVGSAITSVPGSSTVYLGGVISYDNSVKEHVLGVTADVLNTRGAVSSECALAMANGVRKLLKSDLAVSITGIAGPGGGTDTKPVGLVWFGFSSYRHSYTESKIFKGDRAAVRSAAIDHALQMLTQNCAD